MSLVTTGPHSAFLLAGGLGERLRPLSDRIPKCLAPIGDTPLLGIWLDLCARHGVRRVLINASRHVEQVEAYLRCRPDDGLQVQLVREDQPVGNAGTIRANRSFVADDESFFILYSDNLTDVSLTRLAAFHHGHRAPLTMGLFHTPAPHASGIVRLREDGLITDFVEKPEHPEGDLANAGVYIARQSLFEMIPADSSVTDFGRDVFPRLLGQMYGHVIEEYLMDIGNPAALALASRQWAERKLLLASGRSAR